MCAVQIPGRFPDLPIKFVSAGAGTQRAFFYLYDPSPQKGSGGPRAEVVKYSASGPGPPLGNIPVVAGWLAARLFPPSAEDQPVRPQAHPGAHCFPAKLKVPHSLNVLFQ